MLLITYKKIKNTDGVYKKSNAPFSSLIFGINADEFNTAKVEYLKHKETLLDIGCNFDAFFEALKTELQKPKTYFHPSELRRALSDVQSFIENVSKMETRKDLPKDLPNLLSTLEMFNHKLSSINTELQYHNSLLIPFIKYALIGIAVLATIASIATFFVLPGLTGMLVSGAATVLSGLAIYLPPKLAFYTNLNTRAATKCAINPVKTAFQNNLATSEEKITALKTDIRTLESHTKNASARHKAIISRPLITANPADKTYLHAHKKLCKLNHHLKTAKEEEKAIDIREKYRPLLQKLESLDEAKRLSAESIDALRSKRQRRMDAMEALATEASLSDNRSSIFKRYSEFTLPANAPATYKPWKPR